MPTRRTFLSALGASTLLPFGVDAAEPISLRSLYNKDLSFSDLATSLDGSAVEVLGFMAPPLKANTPFFVLTKSPMSVCPFCETEAEWPDDILAVYTKRVFRAVSFSRRIRAYGTLTLGTFTDPDTGFLSRVRLQNASFKVA